MMARLFAYPRLSVFVLIVWLTLNQSVSLGQIIIGTALGLFAAVTLSALQQPGLRAGNPVAVLRLVSFVGLEIVRSNIAVARIVLRPRAERRSGFLTIKLEIDDPYALTVLACILTATPGSLWVNYDPRTGLLLLHVLDLIDEAEWAGIVAGYEARLKEIFR